jgi:hypothetical protein
MELEGNVKILIAVLALFLFASTNSTKAQTTIPGPGESIAEGPVAYPGGPAYSVGAFTGSIGPHYLGHDLQTIYSVLESRLSPRGEYEKTSEYQERLRRAMIEPIVGELRPSGLFAFVFRPTRGSDIEMPTLHYDADREEMIVNVNSVEDNRQYPDNREGEYSRAIIWMSASSSRSYEGSNAFGATAEVTSINGERYALLFDQSTRQFMSDVENNKLSTSGEVRFHLSVDEARDLRDRLRVLIVCRIKEPPVTNGSAYNQPTISDPTEIAIKDNYLHVALDSIWVFDDETGKVYAKSTDAISSVP